MTNNKITQQNSNQLFSLDPYFKILNKFCINDQFANIDNQLLVFHTIKQPQFQIKNIILNLYVDGSYIFVHENNKDMELLTYLQAVSRRNNKLSALVQKKQMNITNNENVQKRQSKRFSLMQKQPNFTNSLNKIILYLNSLHIITYGYNYPILKKYQKILQTLMLYCYKQKFPIIKHYEFRAGVLRALKAFYQPEYLRLRISPKFKIGIIDSPSNEYKFKSKNTKKLLYTATLSILDRANNQNQPPKIPQKQALQMCNIFLSKCKDYYYHVKNNQLKIQVLFESKDVNGQPIQQYFDFLKVIFSSRIMKFKQKKKAQFMQHIEKLFNNIIINQKDKNEQKQQNLISIFINFLLKMISYDKEYKEYLQGNTEINYNQVLMQIPYNRVQPIKNLRIFNCDQDWTKIKKIKYNRPANSNILKLQVKNNSKTKRSSLRKDSLNINNEDNQKINKEKSLFKNFHQTQQRRKQIQTEQDQKPDINQNEKNSINANVNLLKRLSFINSNSQEIRNIQIQMQQINRNNSLLGLSNLINQNDWIHYIQDEQQKYLSLKKKSIQLLILIILNINQEYIQESVQTLNYFIKNPTILNWKSFSLFDSIPKYQNQFGLKKRILQQWYLTSNQEIFQLYTQLLRLILNKTAIHVKNLKSVQIIMQSELSQLTCQLMRILDEIHKLSKSINSWFKQQLFTTNHTNNLFNTFQQKLNYLCSLLDKSKQLSECGCISITFQIKNILINLGCFEWIKLVLRHLNMQTNRINTLNKQANFSIRKNHLKNYQNKVKTYINKLKSILLFLISAIQIDHSYSTDDNQKIQSNYKTQYEMNLLYIQTIICVFSHQLSSNTNLIEILLKIIQIGNTYYNINLIVYLQPQTLYSIFQTYESSLIFFNLITSISQNQQIQLSTKYLSFLKSLDHSEHNYLILLLTSGQYNQKRMQLKNRLNQLYNRSKEQNDQYFKIQIQFQNSWYYFIYKLSFICKDNYKVHYSKILLLKYFYENIFLQILENQKQNKNDMFYKKNKNYLQEKTKQQEIKQQINKIKTQIIRRKYLTYFIIGYNESIVNYLSFNERKFPDVIQLYIKNSLIDIQLYEKIQKLAIKQNLRMQGKKGNINDIQTLYINFVQYYIYDLIPLLQFLQETNQFDKIFVNLERLNKKLVYFLKNTNIGKIQRHLSQQTIQKILKYLQEKRKIPKFKDPRQAFQQCKYFKEFNVQSLKFLQPKQIKKIQSIASRKWKKAIKTLYQFNFQAQHGLIYEINNFPMIYSTKLKDQTNQVINNEDLFKKLISTFKNLNRVLKKTQNKLFIIGQVKKFVKNKFQFLVDVQQSRQSFGRTILQSLNQTQILEAFQNQQNNKMIKWNDNLFEICLKLDILKQLNYFAYNYTLQSLQNLLDLLKKSRKMFFQDYLKISITKDQFKDLQIKLQPFYIILEIINDQINFQKLKKYQFKNQGQIQFDPLKIICLQLYLALIEHQYSPQYQWFDNLNKNNSKFVLHQKIITKLIQKIIKNNKQYLFKVIISQLEQIQIKQNDQKQKKLFKQGQKEQKIKQQLNSFSYLQNCYYILRKNQQYTANNKNLIMVINSVNNIIRVSKGK